ncbi:MAG: ABC transporter ATP-binding protein [Anaerolineae bacterium]|nr:ABC transporter ATP-binding protein [Anaerolineae bacterium]
MFHARLSAYGDEHGKYDPRLVRRLLGYLQPHLPLIALGVVLIALSTVMSLVGPYLIKVIIDEHIARADLAGMDRLLLLTLGTYVVGAASFGAQLYLMGWIGQRMLARMRDQIFDHVQRLSLDFFDRQEAGDTMSRLINDVDTISHLLSMGLTSLPVDLCTLVGIVAAMLLLHVQLALLSFTLLPFMVASTIFFARRARRAYRLTRQKIGAVSADLQESIAGVRVVQSFARERANQERFDQLNRENRDANVGAAAVASSFFPTVDVLNSVGMAIIVGVGGVLVLRGQITVGIIFAFLSYLTRFFWPIRDLSQLYNSFLSAMAGSERIFQLLDTPPAICDKPEALALPRLEGRVEFRHVTFAYLPGQPVLHDVNLRIEPGETLAIVGPTGAGKTTIASLVARLYDVTEGAVLVDGHDVRDVQIASLRSQMGVVLQENFLFSGTIRDNIRYGRLDASDEEVVAAARMVNADSFIERLPKGYDTEVMERGANFSLGQRQLIAFARALLADPRILILDEATSSVDTLTEQLIQRALARLLKGRTSVVIAHRLSTIRSADRVVVIDGGRIVEEGTHEQLMARRGLYHDLYMRQYRAEVEEAESRGLSAGVDGAWVPRPAAG